MDMDKMIEQNQPWIDETWEKMESEMIEKTVSRLIEKSNIPEKETVILCDKLAEYSFWRKTTQVINNEKTVVY